MTDLTVHNIRVDIICWSIVEPISSSFTRCSRSRSGLRYSTAN